MTESRNEKKYMQLALRLAGKGSGFVSPNPMVGAVFVRDGVIIGRGYHEKFGGPHAEINAIDNAGGDVRGATLYCTLEPCSHTDKKTPPCAQRLIKEGIHRVVISTHDPNPLVNGSGIRILKDAGIDVKTGLLEKESREMNRFFNKYISAKAPFIMVKIAQTLDGFIAQERTKQTWITNPAAQKLVHQWRSEYDAVLIGIGTLKSDNPRLTVRALKGRDPIRILVDRDLEANPEARFFDQNSDGRAIIFAAKGVSAEKINALEHTGAEVILVERDRTGKLPLSSLLSHLHESGISSVMIEGGQKIFTQFLKENLTDELQMILAPAIWGRGIRAVTDKIPLDKFRLKRSQALGDNVLLTFRRSE